MGFAILIRPRREATHRRFLPGRGLVGVLIISLALETAKRGPSLRAEKMDAAVDPRYAPDLHPTRRRMVAYLRAIPGDHFRSVARNLGLSVGEARHHLDRLIRDGYVVERKDPARSRYYLRSRHADPERNELFSRQWAFRDLRIRVLTKVRSRGPSSGREVAAELGISRQLASYHLARLEEMGFVHRDGRRFRATSGPETEGIPGPDGL